MRPLRVPTKAEARVTKTLTPAIFAMDTVALVLLALALLPALLTPSVRRSACWLNMMLAWIFYSVGFLLAAYTMSQDEPSFGLCLTLAATVNASSTLCATTYLVFAIELAASIRSWLAVDQKKLSVKILMTCTPYIVSLSIVVWIITVGLLERSSVRQYSSNLFCHVSPKFVYGPLIVTCVLVGLSAVATLILASLTAHTLYQSWKALETPAIPTGPIIRFLAFAIFPGLTIIISIVFFAVDNATVAGSVSIMVTAAFPIINALIFGTQTDILLAWMFWRKKPIATQS